MLSRFFKKRESAETSKAPPAPPPGPVSKAQQAEGARALWQSRLQAAQGDDAALLSLAQTAPLLDIKLAAVDALAGEDTLKQAERELRTHDSRVHRSAKRRLVAAVAQREARAGAQAVIEAATNLSAESPLPANRLVALDRDWQALDASLLEPLQLSAFTELRERLNTLLREQGEAQLRQQQEQQRLLAEAQQQAQAEETARQAALIALEQARAETEPAPTVPPSPPPPPPAKTLSPEQRAQLDTLLSQAEAALAEGQLSDMQQHLQAVDAALDALSGTKVSDGLRARHQALHAERARLKGWQQWGGAQALDALVAEAEALAQFTLAAADAEAPKAPKLRLKPHADSIQSLRARWKEIDRSGAPANQTLWQRFDAALQTAYQPVAAQQAALKAARQENLQAREALLATLDALSIEAPTSLDDLATFWKEQLRALGSFQLAWRQLGPLEHTVPAGARNALQQRLRSSVERIEAPIEAARRMAESERERLIVRAEALVQELARNPAMRDAPQRVRELQAEWQQHARTLPLARAVEGALWARFKGATDAVFAQREAAFSARDAELAANLAAREALLVRLSAIDLEATPVAEMQRTLGEVDRAWRQPVEVPRAALNALEARFRDARAAVAQAVAESAQKRWQAQCDTLAAKLALCEERDDTLSADEAELASRWAEHEALPAAWEQALGQRWSQPAVPGPLAEPACDELLLQLEAALELPASPEWQAARRDLKLRALKDALEGRAPQGTDPVAQRTQWFAAVLRQNGMTPEQRDRLHALIAALRRAAPGSLGGTAR
jgi:exonuclease SbcC